MHIITTKDVLLEGLNSNFTDSATAKTEVSEEYLWFVKGCRYPIFEHYITTKDKIVYISYDTFINTNVNFIVANTTGMVYQNKTFHCSKGEMYNITFNFSGYQPGEYIIHINVNGKVENEKVQIK